MKLVSDETDRVRLMQHNWIGKSEGARVTFKLTSDKMDESGVLDDTIEVFTTRPDTLFGASFIAVAANHPLALAVAENSKEAADFIAECAKLGTSEAAVETAEKRGFDTGLSVEHPLLSGKTLPIHIANFVLMEYGTGAIFGCPAHDQRDLEFAKAYDLPVLPVILPEGTEPSQFSITSTAYTGPGTLINSGDWNGLNSEEGKQAAIVALQDSNSGATPVKTRSTSNFICFETFFLSKKSLQ